MSLLLLTCDCGGAEPLVRNVLREASVSNWMTYEIHKGKEHCRTIVSYLPAEYAAHLSYRALVDFLANAGAFAVIVGYDKNRFFWEDIHANAPVEHMRAIAIAEEFA